jgi:hypothetical protein
MPAPRDHSIKPAASTAAGAAAYLEANPVLFAFCGPPDTAARPEFLSIPNAVSRIRFEQSTAGGALT